MGTALQVVSFLGRAGPKLMLDPGWALTERDICVASRPGSCRSLELDGRRAG
jgi:hypothetical protein